MSQNDECPKTIVPNGGQKDLKMDKVMADMEEVMAETTTRPPSTDPLPHPSHPPKNETMSQICPNMSQNDLEWVSEEGEKCLNILKNKIDMEYVDDYDILVGVDEVGRGPIVGPVCASAVAFEVHCLQSLFGECPDGECPALRTLKFEIKKSNFENGVENLKNLVNKKGLSKTTKRPFGGLKGKEGAEEAPNVPKTPQNDISDPNMEPNFPIIPFILSPDPSMSQMSQFVRKMACLWGSQIADSKTISEVTRELIFDTIHLLHPPRMSQKFSGRLEMKNLEGVLGAQWGCEDTIMDALDPSQMAKEASLPFLWGFQNNLFSYAIASTPADIIDLTDILFENLLCMRRAILLSINQIVTRLRHRGSGPGGRNPLRVMVLVDGDKIPMGVSWEGADGSVDYQDAMNDPLIKALLARNKPGSGTSLSAPSSPLGHGKAMRYRGMVGFEGSTLSSVPTLGSVPTRIPNQPSSEPRVSQNGTDFGTFGTFCEHHDSHRDGAGSEISAFEGLEMGDEGVIDEINISLCPSPPPKRAKYSSQTPPKCPKSTILMSQIGPKFGTLFQLRSQVFWNSDQIFEKCPKLGGLNALFAPKCPTFGSQMSQKLSHLNNFTQQNFIPKNTFERLNLSRKCLQIPSKSPQYPSTMAFLGNNALHLRKQPIFNTPLEYPMLMKHTSIEVESHVKGDQRSLIIGLASVIAKVVRDRIMSQMSQNVPNSFQLGANKGYFTSSLRSALLEEGPTKDTRISFQPFLSQIGDYVKENGFDLGNPHVFVKQWKDAMEGDLDKMGSKWATFDPIRVFAVVQRTVRAEKVTKSTNKVGAGKPKSKQKSKAKATSKKR